MAKNRMYTEELAFIETVSESIQSNDVDKKHSVLPNETSDHKGLIKAHSDSVSSEYNFTFPCKNSVSAYLNKIDWSLFYKVTHVQLIERFMNDWANYIIGPQIVSTEKKLLKIIHWILWIEYWEDEFQARYLGGQDANHVIEAQLHVYDARECLSKLISQLFPNDVYFIEEQVDEIINSFHQGRNLLFTCNTFKALKEPKKSEADESSLSEEADRMLNEHTSHFFTFSQSCKPFVNSDFLKNYLKQIYYSHSKLFEISANILFTLNGNHENSHEEVLDYAINLGFVQQLMTDLFNLMPRNNDRQEFYQKHGLWILPHQQPFKELQEGRVPLAIMYLLNSPDLDKKPADWFGESDYQEYFSKPGIQTKVFNELKKNRILQDLQHRIFLLLDHDLQPFCQLGIVQ
ncbi:MAG: hypothetical protein KDC84_16080 [Crocinitomicaceae bacterium]|nr:hypothetical protein [Crocinitomicaceae bacterium]